MPETSGFKKNSGNRKVVYASGTAARKCAGSVYRRLKLYFTMGEKEKFFEVLQELKESDIIIDNETLELIRIFS